MTAFGMALGKSVGQQSAINRHPEMVIYLVMPVARAPYIRSAVVTPLRRHGTLATMFRLALALGAALIAIPSPAQAKTVPPEDKCVSDTRLVDARARLAAAVEKKDAGSLLGMTASDIAFGRDAPHDKAAFIRTWKLDREPEKSPIWAVLAKIMPLGCALDGAGNAVIPYLFTALEDRDAFATAVTIRPDVNLRSAPNETAPVVAVLHYEVLTLDTDAEVWVKVHTDEGVSGYVRRDLTHTPVGFRAYLKKVAGAWRLAVFIEGD